MNEQQMRERLGAILEEQTALNEAAAGRAFTAEEQAQYDALAAEMASIESSLERADKLASKRTELLNVRTRQTGPSNPNRPTITVKDNLADDPTGGYGENGFGAFAYDVYSAAANHAAPDRLRKWQGVRLAAGDGMTTVIGSEGGYILPPQFGALVDRISLESAVVRPRATKIPMSSQKVTFPAVDDTSHSSTVFGGIQAYFKSEESALTSSKPSFSDIELAVHKLTALAYVTGEMLDWSPVSIGAWLPMKLAQAIAWKEDDKFINGTGAAGEPKGLINSDCVISITKETNQAAATIVFNNIVKMDARIWDAGNRNTLIWIANRTCKKVLPLLTIPVGTAGQPIFLPAEGAGGRPRETLYGYPIVYSEHAKALGTVGDIMLANVGEYLIGDATGKTRTDRDIGMKFDYDQVAFRVITYTGGLMPWRSAFTPQNGDSLAPVIKLATRA